jgi:hypothetical protein
MLPIQRTNLMQIPNPFVPVIDSGGSCFPTRYTNDDFKSLKNRLLGILASGYITSPTETRIQKEKKRQVGDTVPQVEDKVLARIKSSATLSLGRIEHSNFSGCL